MDASSLKDLVCSSIAVQSYQLNCQMGLGKATSITCPALVPNRQTLLNRLFRIG